MLTSIRYPQTNLAVRELGRYFRILCNPNRSTWVECLDFIANCINNICNETIGYTSSELSMNKETVQVWTKLIQSPHNYNLPILYEIKAKVPVKELPEKERKVQINTTKSTT